MCYSWGGPDLEPGDGGDGAEGLLPEAEAIQLLAQDVLRLHHLLPALGGVALDLTPQTDRQLFSY